MMSRKVFCALLLVGLSGCIDADGEADAQLPETTLHDADPAEVAAGAEEPETEPAEPEAEPSDTPPEPEPEAEDADVVEPEAEKDADTGQQEGPAVILEACERVQFRAEATDEAVQDSVPDGYHTSSSFWGGLGLPIGGVPSHLSVWSCQGGVVDGALIEAVRFVTTTVGFLPDDPNGTILSWVAEQLHEPGPLADWMTDANDGTLVGAFSLSNNLSGDQVMFSQDDELKVELVATDPVSPSHAQETAANSTWLFRKGDQAMVCTWHYDGTYLYSDDTAEMLASIYDNHGIVQASAGFWAHTEAAPFYPLSRITTTIDQAELRCP